MPSADDLRAAIADAGPLIHLDEVRLLSVIGGFREVLVPELVAAEADRHRPGWLDRAPASVVIREPSAQAVARLLADKRASGLHPGEVAALALLAEQRSAILLCDDLAARLYARTIGREIVGTLGLLLWAARAGRLQVNDARKIIANLPERTTLHIGRALLRDVLAELDGAAE